MKKKYKNLQKGVGDVMGGALLIETEARRLRDEGRTEGIVNGISMSIKQLMANGSQTFEQACALLGINESDMNKYRNMI